MTVSKRDNGALGMMVPGTVCVVQRNCWKGSKGVSGTGLTGWGGGGAKDVGVLNAGVGGESTDRWTTLGGGVVGDAWVTDGVLTTVAFSVTLETGASGDEVFCVRVHTLGCVGMCAGGWALLFWRIVATFWNASLILLPFRTVGRLDFAGF